MSASAPIRKPASMPRLTHELTRHAPDGSRSAARTSPRLSACLNDSKTSRSDVVNSPPLANNSSTCSRRDMRQLLTFTRRRETTSSRSRGNMRRLLQQSQLREHLAHARAALLRDGHERQTQAFFEQTHQSHRGLYGAGTRLDEVHVHQREPAVVLTPRLVESSGERRINHLRQGPR